MPRKRSSVSIEGHTVRFRHAYFTALELENVRCFGARKQRLELCDSRGRPARWTVILGDNGTGKTTLLRCLAWSTPAPSSLTAGVDSPSPKLLTMAMEHAMDFLGRGKDLEDETGWPVLTASFETATQLGNGKPGRSSFQIEASPDGGSSFVGEDGFPLCYGYGAARHMSESALADAVVSDSTDSLFAADVAMLNPEEWLLRVDYAATKQSPIQRQLGAYRERVKRMLVDILPDIDAIEFTRPTRKEPRPGVRFVTPYGAVRLRDLSLGYTTLVAWLVDFASKLFAHYSASPDPLAMPAICLVDELDLHLHPRWQRTIMTYLGERFPNTQFIVTAHSPLVAQAADQANVVVLRREDDHVIIDNNPREVSRWRVDQILTSDLFGLESGRSAAVAALLAERRKLLGKARLIAKDRKRLAAIEKDIGYLPAAETPEQIEAMDIILRAADKLSSKTGK